jgi:HEPN domain-containing protein
MEDYKDRLARIESLIRQKYYPSAILNSFRIVESGLKDLYLQLNSYLVDKEKENLWEQLHVDFERIRNEPFDFRKASLGSMIMFAKHTAYWDHIREMCESNLRFVKMINWDQIRRLRNKVTHENVSVSRDDALEVLFWTKVFLYESGLVPGKKNPITEVLEAECEACNFTVSLSWNYCPSCGKATKEGCPVCGQKNHNSNKVCLHCDTKLRDTENYKEEKKLYKSYVEAVWADWTVTPLERQWLQQKRLDLGITLDEAERIELQVIPKNYFIFSEIIEATRVDGKIDRFEREFLRKKAKSLSIPQEAAENLIKEAANFKIQRSAIDRLIRMISLNSLF